MGGRQETIDLCRGVSSPPTMGVVVAVVVVVEVCRRKREQGGIKEGVVERV